MVRFFDSSSSQGSTFGQTRRSSSPIRPAPVSFSSGSSHSRGFPERIDANDLGSQIVGAGTNVIASVGRAPGYVSERPLAWANELGPKNQQGKGVIDQGLDFIKSIPFIGPALDFAGKSVVDIGNLPFAALNSIVAQDLRTTASMRDDETINRFGFLPIRVGDIRQQAFSKGWTQQDIDDLREGRKGDFDFGDHELTDNPFVNLGARLALDPLNLVFGAGLITKPFKAAGLFNKVTKGAKALDEVSSAAAIASGTNLSRVSLGGLGKFAEISSRGITGYRRTAIGLTAAEIGTEGLGNLAGYNDQTPISGPLEALWDFGRRVQQNQPLSQGALFAMVTAFKFPLREDMSAARQYLRRSNRNRFGTGYESAVVNLAMPGKGKYAQRRAALIEELGGEEALNDLVFQGVKHYAHQQIAPRLLKDYTINPNSTAETYLRAEMLDKALVSTARWMLDEGKISPKDITDAIQDWVTNARRAGDFSGGVTFQFTPELLRRSWHDYQTTGAPLARVFDNTGRVTVGVYENVMSRDHLRMVRSQLDVMRNGSDTIPKSTIERVLTEYPVLLRDDADSFWAKFMTADGPDGNWQQIQSRLRAREKMLPELKEYLAEATEWERRAAHMQTLKGSPIGPDGKIDPNYAPSIGNAQVLLPSVSQKAARQIGLPPRSASEVNAMRSNGRLAAFEDGLVNTLEESGYTIRSASQSMIRTQSGVLPSVRLDMDAKTDIQTLQQVAAHAIHRGEKAITRQVDHADIVIDAVGMQAQGLSPNASRYTWRIGNMSAQQADDIVEALERSNLRWHFNNTDGTLQVIARKAEMGDAFDSRLTSIGERLEEIAPNAIFDNDEVWLNVIANDLKNKGAKHNLAKLQADEVLSNVERRAAVAADARWNAAETAFSRNASQLRRDFGVDGRPRSAEGVAQRAASAAGRTGAGDGLGVRADLDAGIGSGRRVDDARKLRNEIEDEASGIQGQVLWNAKLDDEAAKVLPRFHPSLDDLLPEDKLKAADIERDLRLFKPYYQLQKLPEGASPYIPGQSRQVQDLMRARTALGEIFDYGAASKPVGLFRELTSPVKNTKLGRMAKQAMYNEFLQHGATVKEINDYYRVLSEATLPHTMFGGKFFRKGDALLPDAINKIANGQAPQGNWTGFRPEVIRSIGENNFVHLVDRASSRYYRTLAAEARKPGSTGQLGRTLKWLYGAGEWGKVSKAGHHAKALYHLWRFMLDPRWQFMNALEADMLGFVRNGIMATRLTGAHAQSPSNAMVAQRFGLEGLLDGSASKVKLGAKKDIRLTDEDIWVDALGSGWLDNRKLTGFVSRNFDLERIDSVVDVLNKLDASDPVMIAMRKRFGDGDTRTLAEQLDRWMYDLDNHGPVKTVNTEAAKLWDRQTVQELRPVIEQVTRHNRQIYDDIVHMFHGNMNRSNLERMLNSYFLLWPVSYQLKAGKWLFDRATKSAFGRQTNLGGAWTVDKVIQVHEAQMVNDPDYAQAFSDYPELWRASQMLFPMTPFDIGTSLSPAIRYHGSVLGFFAPYPGIETHADAAVRMTNMGPILTGELVKRFRPEINLLMSRMTGGDN